MLYNNLHSQEGLYKMTGRYQQSFQQQFNNRVEDLILEHGEIIDDEGYYLDVNTLSKEEVYELIALNQEVNDRSDIGELFCEHRDPKKDDIACRLLKLLTDPTQENRDALVDAILDNAYKSYLASLQETIDDRCGWVYQDYLDSAGYDG